MNSHNIYILYNTEYLKISIIKVRKKYNNIKKSFKFTNRIKALKISLENFIEKFIIKI